jgi:hypothetical protein
MPAKPSRTPLRPTASPARLAASHAATPSAPHSAANGKHVAPANGTSSSGMSSNGSAVNGTTKHAAKSESKPEAKILFQKYFKSVGPRTYAAQLKEAGNGNHFLVLTEAKRDFQTSDVKKLKLYISSEDFAAYFRMLHETAQFIKAHPVAPEMKMKRMRHWAKKEADAVTAARMAAEAKTVQATGRGAIKPVRPVAPTKVAPKLTAAKTTQRRPARGR